MQQEIARRMQDTDRRLQETDQLIKRQARAADRRMDKLDELFNGQAYQESDVRAERLGLFVIRATGSSASITDREEFTPRTFGHRSTAPSRQ